MTTKEAIAQLEQVARICTTTKLAEAALMGARALEREDAGGCEGCRYVNKHEWEQPCIDCKNAHRNRYERGDEHGTD